ncbi:DUF2227 family putative metal-binding protein [Nodosilinea sp. FACHB-13]|uniref:DUF2227 family putative metal-binding protein n=1 Tax=Cyanophyceae TaxID=3028117 RepID=UPI0016882A88|nr:DUF2227 family putative metal-binding protein [Nodosilinea sp. FACHB-13]MBD2108766.1 DUF2227 family putative metal-binding protein [Nodosilinea sp. FACHB-13]
MPHKGLWIVAGATAYLHKLWATADRDVEHKRKPPCLYWLPYDHFVKHRGLMSYGLLIGTVSYGLVGVLGRILDAALDYPICAHEALLGTEKLL